MQKLKCLFRELDMELGKWMEWGNKKAEGEEDFVNKKMEKSKDGVFNSSIFIFVIIYVMYWVNIE